ncbi:hypothetical protein ABZ883_37945 [Streptomyces sp. NPDC046977]|uniref:hypothetical protein n=1 Tax=Streptomyces sp. NPDC046977 TaxID=3154703 RepID=UPI0033FFB0BF
MPAPVVAQVWGNGSRQARLAQFLKGCDVVALDEATAREAGALLGAAGGDDTVDASVSVLAARFGAVVATADPDDIRHLLNHLGAAGAKVRIQPV